MLVDPTAATGPAVSIIVVSFNTKVMTLDCLASIADQTSLDHEVIVIDNDSTDGSAHAIAESFPDVKLLAETTNHGFARANNIAAREATGRYLLLLNPDTVILDHAIDRLVECAQRTPEARIWGGRTIYADGSLNATCAFQHISPWRILCRLTGMSLALGNHRLASERYGGWDMEDERHVDVVTGCFLLMRRADWDHLGGFDDRYFMFGEEADLTLRARDQLGADPMFTPRATIIHHGGASGTLRADRVVRLQAAKIQLINDHFAPAWRGPSRAMYRMLPLSRMAVLKPLARRRPTARGAYETWREVWERRTEWEHGQA